MKRIGLEKFRRIFPGNYITLLGHENDLSETLFFFIIPEIE
jgi:hypothetical protein